MLSPGMKRSVGGETLVHVSLGSPRVVASHRLIAPSRDSRDHLGYSAKRLNPQRPLSPSRPGSSSQMVSLAAQDRTLPAPTQPRIISLKNGTGARLVMKGKPGSDLPPGLTVKASGVQVPLMRILPSTVPPRLPPATPITPTPNQRLVIPTQSGVPGQTIVVKGTAAAAPKTIYLRTEDGTLLRAVQQPLPARSSHQRFPPPGIPGHRLMAGPRGPRPIASSALLGTSAEGLSFPAPPRPPNRESILKKDVGTVVQACGTFFRTVGGRPPGSRPERIGPISPPGGFRVLSPPPPVLTPASTRFYRRPNIRHGPVGLTSYHRDSVMVEADSPPSSLLDLDEVPGSLTEGSSSPFKAVSLAPKGPYRIGIPYTTTLYASPSSSPGLSYRRAGPSFKGESRDEEKRWRICRQVVDNLLTTLEKMEKDAAKQRKWTKEYRKGYEKLYRKKKQLQKQMESSIQDRMLSIRKEALKRRLGMESEAEAEVCGKRARGGRRRTSERLSNSSNPGPPFRLSNIGVDPLLSRGRVKNDSVSSITFNVEELMSDDEKERGGRRRRNSSGFTHPSADRLHCYCKASYDPNKFYVGCDDCSEWFHGSCVGITAKRARQMDGWQCRECEAKTKELFCLCRTPYDDREFYVGCDSCEGWFHPACVGITQTDAEAMSEYHCPSCACRDDVLRREHYPLLWGLLDDLIDHRASKPFREPIVLDTHPDYMDTVSEPMDLSRVQEKLERMEYHRLRDVGADLEKIFSNARSYHKPNSSVHHCAVVLEARFHDRFSTLRKRLAESGDGGGGSGDSGVGEEEVGSGGRSLSECSRGSGLDLGLRDSASEALIESLLGSTGPIFDVNILDDSDLTD